MPLARRAVLTSFATSAVLGPARLACAQSALFMPSPAAAPPAASPAESPPWRRNAVAVDPLDPRPKIAVVIDDMGVMRTHTAQAVALPGPLTLAWFPFAPDLPEQIAAAAARGHEAMLHMPMQAHSNSTLQTGPDPLRVDLAPEINLARLRTAFEAAPGIVGLNNHMGTVATHDPALMALVARETHARGMLFLDSLVIPHSEGLRQAEAAGVPAAARDVFIDNTPVFGQIEAQFAAIEACARHSGYAIAIGHPRPHTLAALESWLPTLPGKGFALWPIAATVALRNRIALAVTV